ncbi:hypothetical protein BaRGS_00023718 [Batillaria attramentaria]|uniref:Uncharacterized protein n=1 Tax=Batillaria attramentaria TaxID=370345 RepID=A0ABD0KD85_9CAEN
MAEGRADGSSRQFKSTQGSPARDPAWIASRLSDDDDLLDLGEDRFPQQPQHSRLQIDYETAREFGSHNATNFDAARLSLPNVTSQISARDTISGNRGSTNVHQVYGTDARESDRGENIPDLLGGGDPTFIAMDPPSNSKSARSREHTLEALHGASETSPLKSSVPNGDTNIVPSLHDGRKRQFGFGHPAVAVQVVNEGQTTCGSVIDYTDDTENSGNTRDSSPRHAEVVYARGGMAREVMLDSFPPPPYRGMRDSGVGSGEGPRQGARPEGEEIHCHSGTSRRNMTDKLARRQLMAVLVLCVLFMIGETIGELHRKHVSFLREKLLRLMHLFNTLYSSAPAEVLVQIPAVLSL